MCNPAAIYYAATIASTMYAAKTQADQYKYQAGVSRYNARVHENQAQEVRNIGTEKEIAHREKVQQIAAAQQAQLGAAGVDIGKGTAASLVQDTYTLGEADALRIRKTTELQVKAQETGAEMEYAQASAYGKAATKTLVGGVLSTGAAVAGKWYTPSSAANEGFDLYSKTPNLSIG